MIYSLARRLVIFISSQSLQSLLIKGTGRISTCGLAEVPGAPRAPAFLLWYLRRPFRAALPSVFLPFPVSCPRSAASLKDALPSSRLPPGR